MRTQDSFTESCAEIWSRLKPISVSPPPNVASGWLKIELCCPVNCESKPAREVLPA
jgi:hypothetical protein